MLNILFSFNTSQPKNNNHHQQKHNCLAQLQMGIIVKKNQKIIIPYQFRLIELYDKLQSPFFQGCIYFIFIYLLFIILIFNKSKIMSFNKQVKNLQGVNALQASVFLVQKFNTVLKIKKQKLNHYQQESLILSQEIKKGITNNKTSQLKNTIEQFINKGTKTLLNNYEKIVQKIEYLNMLTKRLKSQKEYIHQSILHNNNYNKNFQTKLQQFNEKQFKMQRLINKLYTDKQIWILQFQQLPEILSIQTIYENIVQNNQAVDLQQIENLTKKYNQKIQYRQHMQQNIKRMMDLQIKRIEVQQRYLKQLIFLSLKMKEQIPFQVNSNNDIINKKKIIDHIDKKIINPKILFTFDQIFGKTTFNQNKNNLSSLSPTHGNLKSQTNYQMSISDKHPQLHEFLINNPQIKVKIQQLEKQKQQILKLPSLKTIFLKSNIDDTIINIKFTIFDSKKMKYRQQTIKNIQDKGKYSQNMKEQNDQFLDIKSQAKLIFNSVIERQQLQSKLIIHDPPQKEQKKLQQKVLRKQQQQQQQFKTYTSKQLQAIVDKIKDYLIQVKKNCSQGNIQGIKKLIQELKQKIRKNQQEIQTLKEYNELTLAELNQQRQQLRRLTQEGDVQQNIRYIQKNQYEQQIQQLTQNDRRQSRRIDQLTRRIEQLTRQNQQYRDDIQMGQNDIRLSGQELQRFILRVYELSGLVIELMRTHQHNHFRLRVLYNVFR